MTEQTPTPDDTAQPSPEPSETTTPDAPTPGSDLVVQAGSLDARIRYARQIAAAGNLLPRGVLDGVRPTDVEAIAARVFLVAETGAMLSIHPIAALQGVNIIEGKPSLSPALMTALIRRAGHKVRVDVTGTVAGGDIVATARITRSDDPEPFACSWDLDRAVRAGLIDKVEQIGGRTQVRAVGRSGKPSPWQKYTEAMLKWRALGECARDAAEDALMGAHYTPEELGADVGADGEFVDLGHVEATVVQDTPEQVAAEAVRRALTADDVDTLLGLWRALPNVVGRYTWAGEYADLNDFAKRTHVDHPFEPNVDRPTLLEAFGIIKARIEGGGTGEATRPTDEPTPPAPAGDVVDAVVEPVSDEPAPERDVQDAEVVEHDAPTDDPWATGGPSTLDEHDAAIDALREGLGATVATDEAASPRERVAAAHAEQVAANERDRPVDELGGTKPSGEKGSGRAAMAAARAELDRRNEEKRAAEAAGATTRGRGK